MMLEIDDLYLSVKVPRGMVLTMAGVGWFPHDELEDLMPDIVRLMKACASGCIDQSNVCLHFDDLVGELHVKLAILLRKKDISFESREKFFGFLKVAFNHHLKSVVQKYALTFKRTGVKYTKGDTSPVPMTEEDDGQSIPKVALDDEEGGAQNFIGDDDPAFGRMELHDALDSFIAEHLTEQEALVMRQEIEPNDAAMRLAFGTSTVNRKSRKFRILDRHKAEGIGMAVYAYKRTLDRIRQKMLEHWEFSNTDYHDRFATAANA